MKKLKVLILCLVVFASLFAQGQAVVKSGFDGVVVPKYMASGSSTRMSTPFYANVQGLNPGSLYKYYVTFVVSSDIGTTTTGAGNTLFVHDSSWKFIASPSMSAGKHDTLSTMTGSFESWFAPVYTGNSRFTAGNYVYPLIVLEEIGGTDKKRLALSDSILVLKFNTTKSATNGTGVYGLSLGAKKKFVAVYDNDNPISRPLSIGHTEDDGQTLSSAVAFWKNNVEGVNGAWGAVVPNELDSGIRTVRLLDAELALELYSNASSNGKWGNVQTVNPTGSSSSPIYLDSLFAPLAKPIVSLKVNSNSVNEGDASFMLIVEKRFVGNTPSKVKIDILAGTATEGVDYSWDKTVEYTLSNGGQTLDTFYVSLMDDDFKESTENILFKLVPTENAELEGNGLQTVVIEDNDTTKFFFPEVQYVKSEKDGSFKVPVYKVKGHTSSSDQVKVELKSKGKFSNTPSEFYFGSNNVATLNYTAGVLEDSAFVTLNVVDETSEDQNDTFVLVLRSSNPETIGEDSTCLIVIENDDIVPTFTFSKAQINVKEADTTLVVEILRTRKNTVSSDIKLSFVQILSTAANNYDFEFNPTARLFTVEPTDSDTIRFNVKIKDDLFLESTEQIYFKLEELNNAKISPINNLRILILEDDHPVYEIDEINSLDANGKLDSTDADVFITGVVYGVNMRPLGNPEGFQFTIRDKTGGLQVFSSAGSFGYTVKEGDSISIKGVIGQFGGASQIGFIEEINLLGSNATLKEPTLVEEVDESTENDLVKLENVILEDPSEWPLTPLSTNTFKDVVVLTEKGKFTLRIDSDTDVDGTSAPIGYFDVIGLGGQYDFSSPFDSLYYLAPRYIQDIVKKEQKVLTFALDSQKVFERYSDSSELITVSISNITKLTQVDVTVVSGNAQDILDYKFDDPMRLNFFPGDTVKTFKVKVVDNGTDQSDKVLVLGFDKLPYGIITDKETHLLRIIDDETTSITELERTLQLKVFPNPTNGFLNIKALKPLKLATITNIQGQTVFTSSSNQMDLTQLPKGMYMVSLEFGKGETITKRIVVE